MSPDDLKFIDAAILSIVPPRWQKVAMVALRSQEKLEAKFPQFSYLFYAKRVQFLADQGRLQSQGDLDYIRFSEVRLPQSEKPQPK